MKKPAFEDALKILAARKRQELGEHPSPDRLLAYHVGELKSEDIDAVQDHLAICSECSQFVLQLGPVHEKAARQALSVPSGRVQSEWSRFQDRLSQPERPLLAAPDRLPIFRRLGFAYSLAALFLAAAVGLSIWMGQQSADDFLLPNTISIELGTQTSQTRGGTGEIQEVVVPFGSPEVQFIIPGYLVADYARFRVEFWREGDSGEATLSPIGVTDDLHKNPEDELRFTWIGRLPRGRYRIELFGLGTSQQDPVSLMSSSVVVR